MATTAALTENSRQGINSEKPPCVGPEAWLSPTLLLGCGHAYDETPVGIVVYVRNDPVNRIDPDGRSDRPAGNHVGGILHGGVAGDRDGDPSVEGNNNTNDCYAFLKYRPVDHWAAELVGAQHMFWWVQSRDGNQYVISGGPDRSGYLYRAS